MQSLRQQMLRSFFLSPGFFHSANCRQQEPRRYVTSDTLEEIMRHCREFRKNGKQASAEKQIK